jgi:transcriptional regulator of heat shock response
MTSLSERQEILLKMTVRRYVKSAEPVSSEFLSENSGLGVSSATIRNELSDLEEMGYVVQPHTSAGRIPTETGYRYYVGHFMTKSKLEDSKFETLKSAVASADSDAEKLRRAAKALAEASAETALIGFTARDVYYTGLTNLFTKPEFRELALVTTMSKVLDHLDEVMGRVFPFVPRSLGEGGTVSHIKILVGSENPFGPECGVLMTSVPFGDGWGLMALLGPMRMDYDADAALLETATEILKQEGEAPSS